MGRSRRWLFFYPLTNNNKPGNILVEAIQSGESKLTVQISWQQMTSSLAGFPEDMLFYPGNHLSVARLIVEQLFEEKLEVDLSEDEIRFWFSLLLWQS